MRRLSGLGMQISAAVEDPDRPCRVACQDENVSHRFYLVNGEDGWFPFGTDCTRGNSDKKAYCISGKCLVRSFFVEFIRGFHFGNVLGIRPGRYSAFGKRIHTSVAVESEEKPADKLDENHRHFAATRFRPVNFATKPNTFQYIFLMKYAEFLLIR